MQKVSSLPWGWQAEHLKRDLLSKIAETKAVCEANIEAKAQQLVNALEFSDRCPCAAVSQDWSALPTSLP